VAQPAQSLRLDLTHTLAGDAHLPADFFQRVRLTVQQTVAQLQDADLARRERIEHLFQMLAQQVVGGGIIRRRRFIVFDEITNTESSSSSVGVSSESGRRAT